MHENCDTCHQDYDFTPTNARLMLYMDFMRANHIAATCPHCSNVENIYTYNAGFLWVLQQCKLPVTFTLIPSNDIKEEAERTWAAHEGKEAEEPPGDSLPGLPNQLRRELYDWFTIG